MAHETAPQKEAMVGTVQSTMARKLRLFLSRLSYSIIPDSCLTLLIMVVPRSHVEAV
jgi:hypothetical protein